MNKFQTVFSACLLMGLTAWGQARLSPYTVNALRLHSPATRTAGAGDAFRAYIHMEKDTGRKRLKALGVKTELDLGDIITARVPVSAIDELCRTEGVRYISIGHTVRPMMDNARKATGADDMIAGTSLPQSYNGTGVVVGVIDAGFDYSHPAFRDATRSTLRIKRVWEQGTQSASIPGASAPQGFSYGMEFDTSDEILAAATDREGNSHGTHVAGIAAGDDMAGGNPYYGIASGADIVLVSYGDMQDNNVNISDAIAYIYSYAESEGKPCVINMSLGTHLGPHDGTSAFDQVADRLQGSGRLLIGSAGNFGAVPLHASTSGTPMSTVMAYAKAPSNTNVGGDVDIWGEAGKTFAVRLSVLNKSTGQTVEQSDDYAVAADGATYTFTPSAPVRGNIIVTTEINPLNGKPHALVTSGITSMRGSNLIGITVTPAGGSGTVHLWADGSKVTLADGGLDGFTAGDTERTLAEIGGTGKRIVSVGAFVTSHGTGQLFPDDATGDIASFSSRGPAVDGRMKPDITAPGSYIASSLSSYAAATAGTVASSEVWNGRTYQYGYMEGTSMAAPFVAGVVAAWLQAYPDMTPEDLRGILASTASTDDFTAVSKTAGGTWGYGKINALSGVKKAAGMAAASGIGSVEGGGVSVAVIPEPDGWAVVPAQPAQGVTIGLVDVAGKTVRTVTHCSVAAGTSVSVSKTGLPHGIYILRVECDGSVSSYKVVM